MDVIKEPKIGQGLKFLPITIESLKKMAQCLLEELVNSTTIDSTKRIGRTLSTERDFSQTLY